MAATLKVHKWHTQNVCIRLVKVLHITHYRVFLFATGPLTSLKSITKVPDLQVTKTGKSSLFWPLLLSDYLQQLRLKPSSANKQHQSLGIALTTYLYHGTWIILQWFSSTPMLILVLYTILLTLWVRCSYSYIYAHAFLPLIAMCIYIYARNTNKLLSCWVT